MSPFCPLSVPYPSPSGAWVPELSPFCPPTAFSSADTIPSGWNE